MSNVKISALPAATTPLTGTELVPLVQSGVTSQVAVSNIKTAPAGSNTQVQFNNSGAFGASASLVFDGTSLGVGGTPVNARKLLVSTASQTDISINAGSSAYGQLLFGYTGADNKGIVAYNNSDNSMQFYTNVTERMRLNSTGALVLAGGTTSANGIGIAFPATQSASTDANTLDDYEEGTWTPVLNGFTVIGATTLAGQYTKIGRTVYLQCQIVAATSIASTGASSNITGLPFSSFVAQSVPLPISDSSLGSVTYATGLCRTDGKFYTPTWAATGQTIFMSTTFTYG